MHLAQIRSSSQELSAQDPASAGSNGEFSRNSLPKLLPAALDAPSFFSADCPSDLNSESQHPEDWMLGSMAGRSPVMQHLFARMRCTAPHFRLATMEGEPGTGKLLAARTLHRLGPAAAGLFLPWIAAEFLLEPQLRWRESRGGLLYLSHIDELSPDQQRQLRDFLERAAYERIRSSVPSGPLQLIAGTTHPLRRLSAASAFRSDLANRLTAIRFPVPPLRERRDDIPLLAGLFLRHWSEAHSKPFRGFAPGALARLTSHSWPGNVSELESVIATAALEATGQWIRPIDIPRLEWPAASGPAALPEYSGDDPNLDRAILRHVTRVLARVNGNKVRAARLLSISRSTLYRMLEGGTALPPAGEPTQP